MTNAPQLFLFITLFAWQFADGQTLVKLTDQKLEWGDKMGEAQVSLSVEKPKENSSDSNLSIIVFVRNVGNETISIAVFAPFTGLTFYSTDESGKQIDISQSFERLPRISNIFMDIPAGMAREIDESLPPEFIKTAKGGLIAAVQTSSKMEKGQNFKFSNKVILPSN